MSVWFRQKDCLMLHCPYSGGWAAQWILSLFSAWNYLRLCKKQSSSGRRVLGSLTYFPTPLVAEPPKHSQAFFSLTAQVCKKGLRSLTHVMPSLPLMHVYLHSYLIPRFLSVQFARLGWAPLGLCLSPLLGSWKVAWWQILQDQRPS